MEKLCNARKQNSSMQGWLIYSRGSSKAPIRRYRAVVMTCGSPNSSLASLCFHPYLVSLSFYTIPICFFLDLLVNLCYSTVIYRLDAESRKLHELESRGGPELSAFKRSEDATKGSPRRSNARSFHDEASRAMVTQTNSALEKWQQASISSERLSATGLQR